MAVAINPKVNINQLSPSTAEKMARLLELCRAQDIPLLITSGFRGKAEQDALYMKGRRGIPGETIVTKVQYPDSAHNWGVAIDFAKNAKDAYGDMGFFETVAEIAESVGFEAGIRWKTFKDPPHLQDNFYGSVADLKKKYGTPDAFFATWGTK